MSAFIVDQAHIDALVDAAAAVEHHYHDSGLTWYWFDPAEDNEFTRCEVGYSDRAGQSVVGQMLWSENLASIEYRYPDTIDSGEYPGPMPFSRDTILEYVHTPRPGTSEPVAILKALACYEYQTCEHPGWPESQAHAFCEALKDKMIRNLPGYSEAKWEIEVAS